MNKKEFFELVKKDYFEEKSIKIEDLKEIVKSIFHEFGELRLKIEQKGKYRCINFEDYHVVDADGESHDMSGTLFEICIDEENVVSFIDHGFLMITKSNKNNILFLSSMIGKKIIL